MRSFFQFSRHKTPESFDLNQQWILEGMQRCVDGFWVYQDRNFFASPQLKTLLGYEADDKNLDKIEWWSNQLHHRDVVKLRLFLISCLRLRNSKNHCEVRIRNRQGQWMWQLIKCYPHRLENGRLASMMGAITNITPYRLLHNQLERTIEDAERTSQAKSKFIASLNHELRTPLMGIIGHVNFLEECDLNAQQETYVKNIAASAELLLSLVNDILDISKIAAGKLELDLQNFSLIEIINNMTALFKPMAELKNLKLNTNFDSTIPDLIKGDKVRIQQVLVNLINNAIKFTSDGHIDIKVTLRNQDESTLGILFQITDTGSGIEANALPHLFQDFTQGSPSVSTRYGGTGLGLSICKKLVALMGGEIGVQSAINKGSTFWFSIPFEMGGSAQTVENEKPPQYQTPLNILIAEDNVINQQVLAGFLKKDNHKITIAHNGEEAISLFNGNNYDVILMDINMPKIDGLAATQVIRSLPKGKDVVIIAVTADTVSINAQSAANLGFNIAIDKPIDKSKLLKALHEVSIQRKPVMHLSGSAVNELSFLNERYFKQLLEDLGPSTTAALLRTYLAETIPLVKSLQSYSKEDLYKTAHTLAGTSENLGLKSIGNAARKLMENLDEKSIHSLLSMLDKQQALIENLHNTLEKQSD